MLKELDNYDWGEVFKYAEPHECEILHKHGPESVLGSDACVSGFSREDVVEILAIDDGDNDGPDWVGVFRLQDGRFACIRAGCDYTGWG